MTAQGKTQIFSVHLLFLALLSCGRPTPDAPTRTVAPPPPTGTSQVARIIPRRSVPITLSDLPPIPSAPPSAPVVTNSPPSIRCGPAQSFPCSSADGQEATIAVHVADLDGDAITVVWSADGKERHTEQVPAGNPTTSAYLTFSYTFTPGDHGVTVTANDGHLQASCETSVVVQKDVQQPVVVCPQDITVAPDPGQCAAIVTFAPTVTDNCPDVHLICDPPSGTAFPIGVTTVTCAATDIGGNTASCGFDVVVRITNRCPKNDSYWRQKSAAWPVNSLLLGRQVYTRSQLVSLMHANTVGDLSVPLARQLIAACLNTAAGSDPRPICAQLAQAHELLGGFSGKLPFRINMTAPSAQGIRFLTTVLNSYNNGMLTPNCAP